MSDKFFTGPEQIRAHYEALIAGVWKLVAHWRDAAARNADCERNESEVVATMQGVCDAAVAWGAISTAIDRGSDALDSVRLVANLQIAISQFIAAREKQAKT